MRCREHCIGGDFGGHHAQCPDARECPGCEGPVPEDQVYCSDCIEDDDDGSGGRIDAYALEPWDFGNDL